MERVGSERCRRQIIMANLSLPGWLYLKFLHSDLRPCNRNTMLFDQPNDFIKRIVLVTKMWTGDATSKCANIIVDLRYFSRPGVRFKGGYNRFFGYLHCRQSVHDYCEVHDVCHDAGNVERAVYIRLEKYIFSTTGTHTSFGRPQ